MFFYHVVFYNNVFYHDVLVCVIVFLFAMKFYHTCVSYPSVGCVCGMGRGRVWWHRYHGMWTDGIEAGRLLLRPRPCGRRVSQILQPMP